MCKTIRCGRDPGRFAPGRSSVSAEIRGVGTSPGEWLGVGSEGGKHIPGRWISVYKQWYLHFVKESSSSRGRPEPDWPA